MHIYKKDNLDKKENKSLLLSNLSKYLDKDITEIKITKNENGKPRTHGLYFSVSHSHNYLVHAFSVNTEIGIDIERVNSKRNHLRLASRYFNKLEFEYLESLSEAESRCLFYQLWTAKEAICKAEGGRLWFYLERNYLNSDGSIKSSINNHSITNFNNIKNFSLSIASLKSTETIQWIYEKS